MKIAVTGGTGTLGRRVTERLRARDHRVRSLSRNSVEYPVDLATGEGLDTALATCDVVVDASNSPNGKRAQEVLVEGSKRLLAAEEAAGVRHHVCISVVGCERVPTAYFRAKAEQERVVEQGSVPWSIVRATQFHDLLATTLTNAGRWRVLPVPRVPLQTVSVAEVADAVADIAEDAPRHERVEVAGPEIVDARELARMWRSVSGLPAVLLPIPLPPSLGRALRSGALTVEEPDIQCTMSFVSWLASRS